MRNRIKDTGKAEKRVIPLRLSRMWIRFSQRVGSPLVADSVEKLSFANDPEIREEFRLILRASWEAC